MTNYYYEYTATSELMGFGLSLDDSYIMLSNIATVLLGILAFALVLFTALTIKRARPFGIVVAVAQPIGIFAATKVVLTFADIDFSALDITVNGSSQSDALDKLYEKMGDVFIEEILPQMLMYFFWAIVLAAVTIMTFIYFILLLKVKSKVFAIFAIILVAVRHFVIPPVETISLLLNSASQEIQTVWDIFFRFVFMLPLILVAIQGLINLLNNKKDAQGLVAEAEEPAVEEPAVEAPVAEESAATQETKNTRVI